ncbi:unnamed protein product [Tuber melanosporum]|uniref:CCR4-NOT transcription complex subunit 11 n=1 Tax=Tuber melanosporum (strain Mel28) TaxID=656061 RepID=D5GN46_TUBMM|nr:uncharacterized protein GSTUM_00011084001 [Tuber melanosporum]CAZ85939.1 unnamed protein product [Tuber melanosporum]
MLLSTDPLPAELVRALTIFTDPFQKTANAFLSIPTVRENAFTRVCELHNTLEILSTVPEPIVALMQILGTRIASGHDFARSSAREYLGFMLNAEFVLFEAYRIYGLRMNPSLSHWVDVCRDYEAVERQKQMQQGDGRGAGSGIREEVLRIRVAFVKGILGEHGDRLAGLSPHEFAGRGLEFVVDVESFTEALREQGIYDAPMEGKNNLRGGDGGAKKGQNRRELGIDEAGASVGGSGCSSASGLTSGVQTPSNGRPSPLAQDTAAEVSAFLVRAMSEELRPNVVSSLLATLKSTPSLLTTYPLDFLSTPTLASLISNNPVLARGILLLLLSSPITTTTPPSPSNSHRRQEILSGLSFLTPTLNALETINILITQTSALTEDETNLLIHNFLSNGTRSAEEMLDGEYRDGGSGKRAQARQVQLLCLFVQSLLRAGVISLRDVYYEVQMLGVTFMYVKEARELWKAVCG